MMSKKYRNKNWLIQKHIQDGLSITEMANLCHVSNTPILYWMQKLDIKHRNQAEAMKLGRMREKMSRIKRGHHPMEEHKRKISQTHISLDLQRNGKREYQEREWLYQKYIIEKLSMRKIRQLCHVNSDTIIQRWLKRFNIAIRSKSEATKSYYKKNPEAKMVGAKNPNYGRPLSGAQRVAISKISKSNWLNNEYKNKVLTSCEKRPTKPEKIFDEMTPPNIRYVGNRAYWKTLLDGSHKNPDFKVTGQKKLIEIWGNYWHKNHDPQGLINQYKQIGYDCLIFWENEIYHHPALILEKVREFLKGTA